MTPWLWRSLLLATITLLSFQWAGCARDFAEAVRGLERLEKAIGK